MRRSLTSNAARILFAGAAIALLSAPLAAQRTPAMGIRTLADVRELHDLLISPASDAVFNAATDVPTNAKGWSAARGQALVLAESANLLVIGTRVRDNGNWMNMSRALVDAAALAASAAAKKDAKALEAATDAITVSCMNCHQPYRDGGRQMGAPK
jgi:prophage DNA circulation protein